MTDPRDRRLQPPDEGEGPDDEATEAAGPARASSATPPVQATPPVATGGPPGEGGPGSGVAALRPTPGFDARYPAISTLGHGGMGVVTLHHDRTIGRQVALKTALESALERPEERGSQGATWRFVREARIQGQLEHPAVVPVYDLGLDEGGAVYFSMQRVRGRSLAEAIGASADDEESTAARFSTRRLLSILGRVARALDYAHHRGVVHRDLKPENIMIGDYGEVFILDWGLARVAGSDEPTRDPAAEIVSDPGDGKTRTGEVLGTPGYMAPEQVSAPAEVGARADLYAFGAVLYEVLAGEPLHGRGELPAQLYSTMKCDGAMVSDALEVAPELATLVADLTRLDPNARPASARVVADAIEAYLDGDRDARLRQKAARQHLEKARAALAADHDALEGRRLALAQVGRALALSPELEAARALLFELLTTPPSTLPPEAQAMLDRSARDAILVGARTAVAGYLAMSIFVPIALWMGVRSWPAFLALGCAMALCAIYTATFLWRPPKTLPLPHLLLTSATVAISSVMFGPLVLVPMLAVSNSVSYLASVNRRQWLVIGAGVSAVILPALLQLGGLLPATYAISLGVINILPWMMDFPPLPTMAFLVVTQAGIVIAACVFVLRLTRRAAAAEKKVLLQAWQLEQLVGRDT